MAYFQVIPYLCFTGCTTEDHVVNTEADTEPENEDDSAEGLAKNPGGISKNESEPPKSPIKPASAGSSSLTRALLPKDEEVSSTQAMEEHG
jgi:hypothetical protein